MDDKNYNQVKPDFAKVAKLEGTGFVRHSDGSITPLKVGMLLKTGDVVVTNPGALASIQLAEGDAIPCGGENGDAVAIDDTILDFFEDAQDVKIADGLNLNEVLGDLNNLEATAAGNSDFAFGANAIRTSGTPNFIPFNYFNPYSGLTTNVSQPAQQSAPQFGQPVLQQNSIPPGQPFVPPPPPPVTVINVETREIITNVITVGDPTVNNEYTDETTRTIDTETNKEIVVITRYWKDTTTTVTTTTTTKVIETTTIYSDGSRTTTSTDPVITSDTKTNTEVKTREEIIYSGTEDPIITTTYIENTVVNPVTTNSSQLIDTNTTTVTDDEKDTITTTVTRTYEDNTTTVTTTTTTRTPVYTITYSNGTTETEYGDPIVTTTTSETSTTTPRIETEVNVVTDPDEDQRGGPQGNNGFGNGDDPAPGNSLDNNNAENNTTPPVDDPTNPPPETDGQNPGNDKDVGGSPWDGETGDSGNPGNGNHQDEIDTDTNNPPGQQEGTNQSVLDPDPGIDTGKDSQQNNGHGNGDQTAPGNSGGNNNAENSTVPLKDVLDPTPISTPTPIQTVLPDTTTTGSGKNNSGGGGKGGGKSIDTSSMLIDDPVNIEIEKPIVDNGNW
jgi:hypothetical protein